MQLDFFVWKSGRALLSKVVSSHFVFLSLFLFRPRLPTSLHKFIQWTKESLERTTKSKFGRSEHCTMQHDEKGKWVNKYIGEKKETLIDASRRKFRRDIVYIFFTLCSLPIFEKFYIIITRIIILLMPSSGIYRFGWLAAIIEKQARGRDSKKRQKMTKQYKRNRSESKIRQINFFACLF